MPDNTHEREADVQAGAAAAMEAVDAAWDAMSNPPMPKDEFLHHALVAGVLNALYIRAVPQELRTMELEFRGLIPNTEEHRHD